MITSIIKQYVKRAKHIIFNAINILPESFERFKNDLYSLDENMSNYERSYQQYSIKAKYGKYRYPRLRYILSFILFHLSFIKLKFAKEPKENYHDCVYCRVSKNEGIIPNVYKDKIKVFQKGEGYYLGKESIIIIKKASEVSNNNWPYLLELLYNISSYDYIYVKFKPKEIITTYESSPSSSLLTEFCNINNIKHTNFMHGEKLFSHINTLSYFNKIIVWDKYYLKLFNKLRFKYEEYLIENPWEEIDKNEINDISLIERDFCFYLNYENKETLLIIKKCVYRISALGYKVKIRPHPSQINDKLFSEIFDNIEIENPTEVSIKDSLKITKGIISRYSTVLFQAYTIGKACIIDDLSNPREYEQLLKAGYIMLKKDHKLLSSLLMQAEV